VLEGTYNVDLMMVTIFS